MINLSAECRVIDAVSEPEPKMVVALDGFQMQRLPVYPDEMSFSGCNQKIRTAGFDFNARCLDAWNVHGQSDRVRELAAVVARLAKVRRFDGRFRAETATGGRAGIDDRMHGKK